MSNVRLISVTPDAEKTIAYCARVSSDNPDNPDIVGLLKYCIKHSHWSIYEMSSLTLEIKTSRAISAQLLRHRSFTAQEFSQRYQAIDSSGIEIYAARRQDKKNRQNSIDDISDAIKVEWEARQLANWNNSFENYTWALDNGIAKECARFVLPLGCSTKIFMSGTLRSWITYMLVRLEKGTQKEHRDIALECFDIFKQQFPIITSALKESHPDIFT